LLLALSLAACNNVEPKHTAVKAKSLAATTTTAREASSSTSAASATSTTTHAAGASGIASANPTAAGDAPCARPGVAAITARLKATKMATLEHPVAIAVRKGEVANVYVATKTGTVRRLRAGATDGTLDVFAVLDISDKVATGGEQGLLDIVFSPDGNTLYATYTDKANAIHLAAFPWANNRAQVGEEKTILTIPHPQYPDHNGGHITWGPDGLLYLSTGDGGGVGDAYGNAQNLNALLGKILRIKPNAAGGYTVPADNPFVNAANARPEIWHYGLRNPWRFSFDRSSGELWIGDVGQNESEEVNHVAPGAKGLNFGWSKREGAHAFSGGAKPTGAVDPEIETAHSDGNCAITGGYVYRGAAIKGLGGVYLFSDYCRGELVGAVGGLTKDLGVHVNEPASFGEDATGELWVLSQSGGVFRLDRA
jgi:glucose/arabinose dehydrogenase